MSRLVSEIASGIHRRVRIAVNDLAGSMELRSVFHGPPRPILDQIFNSVANEGGIEATLPGGEHVVVPVVLVTDSLQAGVANPPIGVSGLCDPTHLMSLRNHPSCPRFVALIPPGRHTNLSSLSTSDEFGLSAENNSGNAMISDWWHDDFIQALVSASLGRVAWPKEADRERAAGLIELAVRAADEADRHDVSRFHAWAVLARVFSIGGGPDEFGRDLSFACGFPPLEDGGIDPSEQGDVLRRLASELEDEGFATAIGGLEAADDTEAHFLGDLLAHLQSACDAPTLFTRAAAYYYSTSQDVELGAVPGWWRHLTVERWAELLADEPRPDGAIVLECTNSIIPKCRGVNALVLDSVELRVSHDGEAEETHSVQVVRESGGAANRKTWDLQVRDATSVTDIALPPHRTPARYAATSPGLKKGVIKVISLQTWENGVFVFCRTASKLTAPRRAKANKEHYELDCSLFLTGQGRHYVDVYVRQGVAIGDRATGRDSSGVTTDQRYSQILHTGDQAYGFEIEAVGDCFYDLTIVENAEERVLRIFAACDETTAEGARSEFDRLIRLNRQQAEARATTDVQIDRQLRSSDLQTWLLERSNIEYSFLPLVLSSDYASAWRRPQWDHEERSILSRGRFLHDPRPHRHEMSPPGEFLTCRASIADRIRGEDDGGLIEAARLGEWLAGDAEFGALVEAYLLAYLSWLNTEPAAAAWADIAVYCAMEHDGSTLAQEPDAILINPLHPVRLGWQCVAQRALFTAYNKHMPCPAASILDPGCVPDVVDLPIRLASGEIGFATYFAVESTSDYWSVLWNGRRLDRLAARADRPPFDHEMGVRLGGMSSGFSISQVRRALDDIWEIFAAKPVISVLISSAAGQTNACNEGILAWSRDRFGEGRDRTPLAMGARQLQVIDDRRDEARPDDTEISNLAEDTLNAVRWFAGSAGKRPDLGIIAQLETANDDLGTTELSSPMAFGGLIRHRVRRQLLAGTGAFLIETRSGSTRGPSGDALADMLASAIARLENLGAQKAGYTFAPSVHAIRAVLDRADYAAVSSSVVDPACFLGGWLSESYLWDYDLPSYSHRAGDTNGYYILSRVKEIDCETLREVVGRLPGCGGSDDGFLRDIILEIARRGIPTVRGLAGGDSGASGDLGLFIAARLLQDEFRSVPAGTSLMPVLEDVGALRVALVIPIDPFRGYLDDLQRSLRIGPSLRPDVLVATVCASDATVECRLTPIEVKYRGRQNVLSHGGCVEALGQARSLGTLLGELRKRAAEPDLVIWRLAFQHLLASMLGFGFRVYSQQQVVLQKSKEWSALHARVIDALFSDELVLDLDKRGRLLVIDGSPRSSARDMDDDGFKETLGLCAGDASQIALGRGEPIYDAAKRMVGDWDLFPTTCGPLRARTVREVPCEHYAKTAPASEVQEAAERERPPAYVPPQQGEKRAGVWFEVGSDLDSLTPQDCSLNLSDTHLNQLNVGVVGDLGTGKTQLLKSFIFQVARSMAGNRDIKPNFVVFDYKRDYCDDAFIRAVGGRVLKPNNLPINLFDISGAGSTAAAPWLDRFKFFSDVLDKIYSGIGPIQRKQLKDAVRGAYDACADSGEQPTIYDIHSVYRSILGPKTDAPLSIIDDIVDMQIFSRNPGHGNFAALLDGVVVVDLYSLGQDDRTKNLLVAIFLNLFYEHMLRIPKRGYVGEDPQLRVIDSFLLVDEADNIMRFEFDVLRKILLQGREFGVGTVLASQYLRHFKTGATDYREPLLTWFIHKVPNVTPQELSALGLGAELAGVAERIKTLRNHECLFKTSNRNYSFVRGTPFFSVVG